MASNQEVVMAAGPEWIRLTLELEIEQDSALDFSRFRPTGEPGGKLGHIIARPDGHFAFEKAPAAPLRFYGVNLCFSAHYIEHDQADRLANRLARLGYNTIRIHHYERELCTDAPDSVSLNPAKLDQLDYLVAACKKRGIYVSTDLFVSRAIPASILWPGAKGNLDMQDYKIAIPVNENAWNSWKAFSRNLLTHVNPFTGLSWAEDPAIAWLCMINEGNFGNFMGKFRDARLEKDWQAAWNVWLRKQYSTTDAVAKAWGIDPAGDLAAGSIPFLNGPFLKDGDTLRERDFFAFLAQMEIETFRRMKAFLRDEIGVKALLTNHNGWTSRLSTQAARNDYDYVDDHFYVDHPEFMGKDWNLPSRQLNTSYVAEGTRWNSWNTSSLESHYHAFVRLFGKPFSISEFNYPYPSRFRSQSGLYAGALAALQDWSVAWRFCYSHYRDRLFEAGPANYFDLVADPLNQAADRATILLFLRADLEPARHSLAIAATRDELLRLRRHNLPAAPSWNRLALVTRVGVFLATSPAKVPADVVLPLGWNGPRSAWSGGAVLDLDPYAPEASEAVLALYRRNGWLKDSPAGVTTSENSQLTVDRPRDVLTVDTARTCGGYAPEGQTIETSSVTFRLLKSDATIWVSSLDDNPIPASRRLLLTHLTDLQNTGARFADPARQTLLEWGTVPHLVRAGSAEISLKLQNPAKAKVWALSTGGKRLSRVETSVEKGRLVVRIDVAGAEGAQMLYEIVAE